MPAQGEQVERLLACGLALALVLGGAALLHPDDAPLPAPRARPWTPALDEARDDAPPESRPVFSGFRPPNHDADDRDEDRGDDEDDDEDDDEGRKKEKPKARGKGQRKGRG